LQAYSHLFSSLAATATPEIYTLSLHDALPICTPKLQAKAEYDVETQIYRLSFKQSLKTHAKYLNLKAVPIPVALALFDAETGKQLTLNSEALFENGVKDGVYLFDQDEATIEFSGVTAKPVVSLLRNFSAPVNLDFDYSEKELAFLLQYETNG